MSAARAGLTLLILAAASGCEDRQMAGAPPDGALEDGPRRIDAGVLSACPSGVALAAPVAAPERVTPAATATAAALVAQMTLQEKAQQLGNTAPEIARLDLPAYQYWNEALHGVMTSGATSFPISLAMGATWDPALMYEVATAISDEARADNVRTGRPLNYFSPNINVLRDPRWGRSEESFSEDPNLLGRMAVAYIEGMQGDDPERLKLSATAKHFAANNHEAGRFSTSSDIDEATLREFYLPHFQAAAKEARVSSFMAAYNALNGIPATAHRWLLTDLLRDEWGWKGFVVGDCGAVGLQVDGHHYAASYPEAAANAVAAGTNLDCGDVTARYLPDAVNAGLVTEQQIDDALIAVLRARVLTGELGPAGAGPYAGIGAAVLGSDAHAALARKAERRAIVLLRHSGLLPLRGDLGSVAVVGPYAERVFLGGYSGTPSRTPVTVLQGIRARLPGANVVTGTPGQTAAEAAELARGAEVAVVVVGTDNASEREDLDAATILAPGGQDDLIRAVVTANPRTVVVSLTGYAAAFPWAAANAPELLQAWYGGQEAGNAVADVLFGDENPGGKLPVTFHASDAQLPLITDYRIKGEGGIGRTYMYYDEAARGPVLFPFGHGLSYTTFEYEQLSLCAADAHTLAVTVRVRNSGAVAGSEVVQIYVAEPATVSVRPRRSLQAFQRVWLAAGESAEATVLVSFDGLGAWSTSAGRRVVEPGELELMAGASSRDIRLTTKLRTDGTGFVF